MLKLLPNPWFIAALLGFIAIGQTQLILTTQKKLGAARAQCEVSKLKESNSRSDVVRDLETESLRDRIALLEGEIAKTAEREKVIRQRHSESEVVLERYRKELDDARKATPDLDAPLPDSVVERLRRHEEAYRIRAQGSGGVSLPPDSAAAAHSPLRDVETK